MTTVSVIIPTYNRPKMLAHAIDSVLKQTFQDFEIIVVNDFGCPVETVLENYAYDPRIVYHSHDFNKGLAATRNTGIRAASGMYIAYLDDDDVYYPHHLETLVKHIEESNDQIVYSDAYCSFRILEHGIIKEIRKEVVFSEDFDSDAIFVRNFIPVCCVLHRKECFDVAGFFDESLRVFEDWELWIRFSQHCTFSHLKEITCEYSTVDKGNSLSKDSGFLLWETACRIMKNNKNIISQNPKRIELCISALFDIASGQNTKLQQQQALLTQHYLWQRKVQDSLPYQLFSLLKSLFYK